MDKANTLTRMGGFAAAQFSLSLLCYAVVMALLALFESFIPNTAAALFGLSVLAMVPYFHMGMVLSGAADWARVSTAGGFFLALVSQTAVAWLWAGTLLLGSSLPGLQWTAGLIFLPTLLLACPSSLFVVFGGGWWLSDELFSGAAGQWAGFLLVVALAGLLPPLLYNLGNLFMARYLKRRSAVRPAAELPAG